MGYPSVELFNGGLAVFTLLHFILQVLLCLFQNFVNISQVFIKFFQALVKTVRTVNKQIQFNMFQLVKPFQILTCGP